MNLALYLLAINALTLAAFAVDKRRAVRGQWRVSERSLLMMAAGGGWIGALLGQFVLRHKTRKEPFRTRLYAIIAIEGAALTAIALTR